MDRRLHKKNDEPIEIINFDQFIPDQYKLKSLNRHVDVPQHPAMCLLSASTGGGKTNLLLNILMQMVVHKLYIFTRDTSEDKYLFLRDLFTEINDAHNDFTGSSRPLTAIFELHSGLTKLPNIENINKDLQNVIVFDDLVTGNSVETNTIKKMYTLVRKRNCSLFFLSQDFFLTDKTIRRNCHNVYLFDSSSNKEIRAVCDDLAKGFDFDVFKKMYLKALSEPFSFLTINNLKHDPKDKFRIKLSGRFEDKDFLP